jgi:hypothetical protein
MPTTTRSTRAMVAAAAAIVLSAGDGLAAAESGSRDAEAIFES